MKLYLFIFLFFFLYSLANSQKTDSQRRKIQGKVTDSGGLPVKNAIIYVDSVKTFERTNKYGLYKFRIDGNTTTLSMFSGLHGIKNIIYSGQNEIDFQYGVKDKGMSERELENLGYTIIAPRKGTIDSRKFKDYSDIYQLIREMFTGVVVNGKNILVRGKSTFGNNTTPLFVVDDTYVNDISFINPVEVQSIELLKGSDATIYGTRGGNGVFRIYLKKKLKD